MTTKRFTGMIRCDVPVCIEMENGKIRKVIVCDEDLNLTTACLIEPRGKDDVEDDKLLRLAIEQAENDQDWPAWKFGW